MRNTIAEVGMSVRGAGEKIRQTVSTWEGVAALLHRFGGIEYQFQKRELGHVHGDHMLDIPFPKKVRDELVAAGMAQPHHLFPDTGWISFYIREPADVEHAIALLRRSYDLWADKLTGSEKANTPQHNTLGDSYEQP